MDICEYLEYFQKETWKRIEFTTNTNLNNIRETTLTENLVFSIFRIGQKQNGILIFEALDETANGNDLEIIIKKNNITYYFPTQAKIISPKSKYKYTKISHKVKSKSTFQIDDLIGYAKINGGVPLYLLYSYHHPTPNLDNYGASLVKAEYIRSKFYPTAPKTRWKIPSFNDLYPNSVPLSYLCNSNNLSLLGGTNPLPPSDNWKIINSKKEILEISNHNKTSFNPKFRIQIDLDKERYPTTNNVYKQ